jgi:hypothetical protein
VCYPRPSVFSEAPEGQGNHEIRKYRTGAPPTALYQAFRLFGRAKEGLFSQRNLDALRVIKHCGIAMLGFVALGAVFIIVFGDGEDRPA